MQDFEFAFALYGLLLGLSLTEVLGGLARAIEARLRPATALRIGWLTPSLGAFVLLDLLSFWQAAWTARDLIKVSGHALFAITAFAGAYYLAASLVFPSEVGVQRDLDDHFFRVRRIVLGVLLLLLVCQLAWYADTPQFAERLMRPRSIALTATLPVLMVAAMVARGERWCRLAMIALVLRYVILYVVL